MLIEESKRRQAVLREYLLDMAQSCMDEHQIRQICIKLKALYANSFRHNYAEFFPLIVDIAKNESKYSLDYLSNNLESSRILVEKDYVNGEKEFKGLYKPLTKLRDHLNLEIGRYSYYSVNEQKMYDLERKNAALQSALKKAADDLIDARKKLSSVQTELIAVLSIFAAIVLTFSGSLSFIGNALSGMVNAPFFKAVFFILLCGFVVFNTIFLLLYMVGKITDRNIYAHCESLACTCGVNGKPKCRTIRRIRKRLPYVFWFNTVVLLLLITDLVLWVLSKTHSFFIAIG